MKKIINYYIHISWFLSIIATLGSLYFSEILKYIPCTLCWYQRILMYPLVIIFGVALLRNDNKVYLYTLPMTLIGLLISGYHYLLQKVPFVFDIHACSSGVPCNVDYINVFGFITIPFLSFICFLTINCIILLKILNQKKD